MWAESGSLFHGSITLVSIIKATELISTAVVGRFWIGHKPSTEQAGAGLLVIAGLVSMCVLDGGSNWGFSEGSSVAFALLSNTGNAVRNVAMKGLTAAGHDVSTNVTLCIQCLIALCLLAVGVPLRILWGAWDAKRQNDVDDCGGGGGGGGGGGVSDVNLESACSDTTTKDVQLFGADSWFAREAEEAYAHAAFGLSSGSTMFVVASVALAVYLTVSQFVLKWCDSAVTHGEAFVAAARIREVQTSWLAKPLSPKPLFESYQSLPRLDAPLDCDF